MHDLCIRNGWGDPFSYARSREIYMAIKMQHVIATTYSGPDATDNDGEAEYKSTIADNIKATYTGISVFPTWEEVLDYLIKEKIGKYKNHYYARFADGEIVEMWRLSSDDVLKVLIPKLQRDHERYLTKPRKDQRLSASVCMTEIHTHGTRLI